MEPTELTTDINLTFAEWLQIGLNKGYAGLPFCAVHDTVPLDEIEEAQFQEGFDPCVSAFRIYPDGDGPSKD